MPIVTPGTFTLAALTSELNGDPLGIGYAAVFANSDSLAVLLNTSPEPVVAGSQESVYRKTTPTTDMVAGLVKADFTALTVAERELCALVFAPGEVKTGDATLRTLLSALFPVSTTRTNLIAASSRLCSRAEALWGDGFTVSGQVVAQALGR
jgi:hypothetical protein